MHLRIQFGFGGVDPCPSGEQLAFGLADIRAALQQAPGVAHWQWPGNAGQALAMAGLLIQVLRRLATEYRQLEQGGLALALQPGQQRAGLLQQALLAADIQLGEDPGGLLPARQVQAALQQRH
ncbi:hypothetical protein D3C76_1039530 [compost metagenome]